MATPTIAFAKSDDTWAKHDLSQMPIRVNGESTGYKAIVRTGAVPGLVAITHQTYKLYPHEEALAVADDLAKVVGAKRLDKLPRVGHQFLIHGQANRDSVRVNAHTSFSTHGNRMNAFYLLDDEFSIEKKDTVRLGFSVHNAIDGSRTFGADGFTYRTICTNGVIVRDKSIAWLRFVHSKNMDISRKNMGESLGLLVERTRQLVRIYKEWSDLELEKKTAEQLVSRIPDKYLPDFIETEKKKFSRILGSHSLWDTYNAITQPLWHGKGEMVYKENIYERLHRVLVPLARTGGGSYQAGSGFTLANVRGD
jgi:hypothetical protein